MSTRIRATATGAAIVALLLSTAACGGSASGNEGTGAEGSDVAKSYDVSLTEFAIVPGEIDVPPGEPMTFVVSNDGTAAHTFAVETGSETVETPQIQPKNPRRSTFPPFCSWRRPDRVRAERKGVSLLPRQQRHMADTLMVAPGQRFDLFVRADYPGVWAFHCHILPRVEGPEGMFGMVTALIVE